MSLKSEIEEIALVIEKKVVDAAVSAVERNRLLGFLHGLLGALQTSDDPAVHAEPEIKPKKADPESEAEKPAAKSKAEKK